jgi:hypothetical protein
MHNLASLQYLGSLVVGRRVLIVGMAEEAADHARELGARRVCIATSREQAESSARRDLEILATELERMELRSGLFDVALVLDLPSLADPSAVLSEAMRVVGLKGHVVVLLRNPSCEKALSAAHAAPLDYYQAYDMLTGLFPSVQMVGQSPFVGYAVADLSFDGTELPVSFDGTLLGDSAEEIEWFLAVCGQVPALLDPYTVVQVPLSGLSLSNPADREAAAAAAQFEQELKVARLELSTRGVKIESLQKEIERELMASEAARARGVELAKQLDEERKAKQRAEIEGQYSRRSQTFDKPQDPDAFSRQRQAEERAKVAENARDELVLRLRADAAELERLRRAQEEHETKSRRTASQLEDLSRKASSAEKELAELRNKLAATTKRDEPARAEHVAALRQAEERARSAEASRDALLEQMRADAAELERLRHRYDEQREKGKRGEQEKSQAIQAAEELRSRLMQLEAELKASQEALEQTKTEAAKAPVPQTDTDELGTARAECADLERRLAEVAANRTATQLELERQTALVRDMAVDLRRARESAPSTSLNTAATNDAVEQEMARLRGALSGQRRARVEAELAAATLQLERDRVQMELLSRDTELVALRQGGREAPIASAALTERDHRIAELESELQAAKWHAAELEARNADLSRRTTSPSTTNVPPPSEVLSERDTALLLCRNLEREMEQARSEQQKQSVALSTADRCINRLEQDLDSHRAREQRLSQIHETCKARIEALEKDVSAGAELRRVLENELAQLQERLASTTAHRTEPQNVASQEPMLKERIARLESELAAAGDEQSRVQTARSAAQIDLRREVLAELRVEQRLAEEQSHQKVAELEMTIIELREKLRQQDEWSHNAGADAARLSGDLSELAAQCDAMERDLRERLACEAALERTLLVLRQDAISAWSTTARSEESAARGRCAPTREDRAAWLDEQLGKEKERGGSLMRELTLVSGRCKELSQALAEVHLERDSLRHRLTQLELERQSSCATADRVRAQLGETEEKLAAAQRARAATSEELAETLAELDVQKRASRPALAEADFNARQEELQDMSSQLAEGTLLSGEKESLIASLTEQLEEREQRAARLEREVAHLIEIAKEHESDIAAWEMELKFRNARIAQLEYELNRLQGEEAHG